jgi:hypothetical protein
MQIQKTILYSLLLLLTGVSAKAQDLKFNTLFFVVDEMASTNTYDVSKTVGYTGAISKQFERFKQLIALASDQQLLNLAANHKNAVVRIYSLKALLHKKVTIPIELLQQFKNDDEKVIELNGCQGTESTVKSIAQFVMLKYFITPAEIKQ